MTHTAQTHTLHNRRSEAGNAALIAMIMIAMVILTVLTTMAANGWSEARNQDNSLVKLHEKWQARSSANILAQVVARDAPIQLESDVFWARANCGAADSLLAFDPEGMTGDSSPAVSFDGTSIRCTGPAAMAPPLTSVFGSFSAWRDSRIPLFEQTGRQTFGLDADNVRLIELNEIYRRSLSGTDVAYAIRYIVEAKFGNYRTRANGELILGATLPSCGTSVTLEVAPVTVVRGNQVDMTIVYAYANKLQIYNSANTLIHEETVPEQAAAQTFVFRYAPAATDTYRVVASGSGGCQAQATSVAVTVTEPPPVCPNMISFSASSTVINSGESVVISWNVQNAFQVTLDGATVPANGSQSFVLTSDRTFTLAARDVGNTCPLTQSITVTVRVVPPCPFVTPQFQQPLTATPNSIAVGAGSTLSWNISGLDGSSGTAVVTGPNGFSQAVGAGGSLPITPPSAQGDYTYVLTAENVCPDGTRLTVQQSVVVSVRACPTPTINSFTVTPSTVTAGGNQNLSFAWNIAGSVDAVSINNGVGGGLPAIGSVNYLQPQTTSTYTLTAVGCAVTQQAQVLVTVDPPPSNGDGSCSYTQENEYFCDQNSNIRFVEEPVTTVTKVGNQVIVQLPAPGTLNYFGLYSQGSWTIVGNGNIIEQKYWSADPRCTPSANLYCLDYRNPDPNVFYRTLNTTATQITVYGGYDKFVATNGECTVNGSFSVSISYGVEFPCSPGFARNKSILSMIQDENKLTLIPQQGQCGGSSNRQIRHIGFNKS